MSGHQSARDNNLKTSRSENEVILPLTLIRQNPGLHLQHLAAVVVIDSGMLFPFSPAASKARYYLPPGRSP
jgi:hypothetical protein